MIRRLIAALAVLTAASFAPIPASADESAAANAASPAAEEAISTQAAGETPLAAAPVKVPAAPEAEALCKALADLPAGKTDEERNEVLDLVEFYKQRGCEPLWLTPAGGLTSKAVPLIAEIKRAAEWGLDPRDFSVPSIPEKGEGAAADPAPAIAAAEMKLTLAVLKYGRYARGGRIINPSGELSSYLDRRPQLLKPMSILEGVAAAAEPDAYLRGLHPAHPQFQKLRQRYLELLNRNKQKSAQAKTLLANMEEWRWMPAEMGEVYIWNNIPDFTQRVMKNGEALRTERIVAGEISKQTPIFTRNLRKIVFRPTWIVPDSIKVRELWPNLLKGGGLMREWALEVRTKEGEPLNWRKINWSRTDIRQFDVVQPNGPKSVMGKVKFSFPSQHTVFMHDSLQRDRWMFRVPRRTYSHGCMRVADPIGLAKIVLREDKGWDAAHVSQIVNTGPLNNEIALDHRIPVHITYFTALAGQDGELHFFPDVYGHERRITQALEGKWDQIVKGRDHLAPVELEMANSARRRPSDEVAGDPPAWPRRAYPGGARSFLNSIFEDGGM